MFPLKNVESHCLRLACDIARFRRLGVDKPKDFSRRNVLLKEQPLDLRNPECFRWRDIDAEGLACLVQKAEGHKT